MNIFTYWEGNVPEYIAKCFLNLLQYNARHPVTVITPENIDHWCGNLLHPNFKKLKSPAQRADCVRVATILQHGGLWVEADCLFIKEVPDFSGDEDFCFMQWDDGRVLNGYFYSRPGSPVMQEWLRRINVILAQGMPLSWTALGEQILTPLVLYTFPSLCRKMNREIFIPINTDRIPFVFFEPIHPSAFIKPQTVAVNLNHSFFLANHPEIIQDLNFTRLKPDMLFSILMSEYDYNASKRETI